jgi:hypothetical protein
VLATEAINRILQKVDLWVDDDNVIRLLVACDAMRARIIDECGAHMPGRWAENLRDQADAMAAIAASVKPLTPVTPPPTDRDAAELVRELASDSVLAPAGAGQET